jgi:hypothetical protein
MTVRVLTFGLLAATLALSACGGGGGGGQSNNAAGLEKAARQFAEAFFGGNSNDAYEFFTDECKDEISSRDFRDAMKATEQVFEVFAGVKMEDIEVDEVKARNVEGGKGEALIVFKTDEDADFDLNEDSSYDDWVYEDGGWRLVDCSDFADAGTADDGVDGGDSGDDSGSDSGSGDQDTTRTGPGASRDEPAPLGTAIEVGGWSIVVDQAVPDGTPDVMAESEFNDPPADGEQFFLVHITATYVGNGEDDSISLFFSVDLGAVGATNVAYDPFEDNCGYATIPDPLDQNAEVFVGGSISGNVCWNVAADDAGSLLLFVDRSFTSGDDRAWFDLR